MSASRFLRYRRFLIVLLHLVMAAGCYTAAFLARFDGRISSTTSFSDALVYLFADGHSLFAAVAQREIQLFLHPLPYAVAFTMITLWYFDLHKGFWRYFGTYDLMRLVKACTASSVALVIVVVFLVGPAFPRSIFILNWLLSICAFGGVRLLARMMREMLAVNTTDAPGRRTLIVGAGDTGETALRELRKSLQGVYNVVGFLDDNPEKQGMFIHGVKVIGRTEDIARVVRAQQVEEVLFAIRSASKTFIRQVVAQCEGQAVRFRLLPNIGDLISGRLRMHQIREVSVDDLLGRDPIHLERGKVESDLCGKCVLITGAGGSIGSELARQVASFKPSRLVLFEIGESPLFEIDRVLGEQYPDVPREPVLGDIMHPDKVEQTFAAFKPDRVFHAAAFKHVPMMERHPVDAVLNNIGGTRHLAEAAIRHGVEKFVMISSDKAVHPKNVMGASKRCAELLLSSLANRGTRFITVRFGNVLGSNGSVVPIFRQQIARGGPVRVTHRDATRYFMTIPEAVELVLQAAAIGVGGEVFLLDMGEPVSILTLARSMIELSGLRVGDDIEVEFTGLRPGEKLHEELAFTGEDVRTTEVPKVMLHRASQQVPERLRAAINALEAAARSGENERTAALLFEICRETNAD